MMSSSTEAETNNKFDIHSVCKRCGADDHWSKECRKQRIFFCWICGRKNTNTTACCGGSKDTSQSPSSKRIPYPEEPIYFDNKKGLCATVGFGYDLVLAKIDTSSFRSFTGELYANELGSPTNIKKANIFVTMHGSEKFYNEEISIRMKFGDWQGYMTFLISDDIKGHIVLGLDFLTLTNTKLSTCGVSITLSESDVFANKKSSSEPKANVKSVATRTSPLPPSHIDCREAIGQNNAKTYSNTYPFDSQRKLQDWGYPNTHYYAGFNLQYGSPVSSDHSFASSTEHGQFQRLNNDLPSSPSLSRPRLDPSFKRYILSQDQWPAEMCELIRQRQTFHQEDPKARIKFTYTFNGISYRIHLAKATSKASVRVLGPVQNVQNAATETTASNVSTTSSVTQNSLLQEPITNEQFYKKKLDPTFIRYTVPPAAWCQELRNIIDHAQILHCRDRGRQMRFAKVVGGISYRIRLYSNSDHVEVRCLGPVTYVPICLTTASASTDSTHCVDMDLGTDDETMPAVDKNKSSSISTEQSIKVTSPTKSLDGLTNLEMEDISSDDGDYNAASRNDLSSISSDSEINYDDSVSKAAQKMTSPSKEARKRKTNTKELELVASRSKVLRPVESCDLSSKTNCISIEKSGSTSTSSLILSREWPAELIATIEDHKANYNKQSHAKEVTIEFSDVLNRLNQLNQIEIVKVCEPTLTATKNNTSAALENEASAAERDMPEQINDSVPKSVTISNVTKSNECAEELNENTAEPVELADSTKELIRHAAELVKIIDNNEPASKETSKEKNGNGEKLVANEICIKRASEETILKSPPAKLICMELNAEQSKTDCTHLTVPVAPVDVPASKEPEQTKVPVIVLEEPDEYDDSDCILIIDESRSNESPTESTNKNNKMLLKQLPLDNQLETICISDDEDDIKTAVKDVKPKRYERFLILPDEYPIEVVNFISKVSKDPRWKGNLINLKREYDGICYCVTFKKSMDPVVHIQNSVIPQTERNNNKKSEEQIKLGLNQNKTTSISSAKADNLKSLRKTASGMEQKKLVAISKNGDKQERRENEAERKGAEHSRRLIAVKEQPAELKELITEIRTNWTGLDEEISFMRVFDGTAYFVQLKKGKGEEVYAVKWSITPRQLPQQHDDDDKPSTSQAAKLAQEQQATSPVTKNRPITGNFERPDEQPHELSQIEDGLIAKQPRQQIGFEESIEQVRIEKPDELNVLQSKTRQNEAERKGVQQSRRLIAVKEQPAELKELITEIRTNWTGLDKEISFMRVFDGTAYFVQLKKGKGEEVYAVKWSITPRQLPQQHDDDDKPSTSQAAKLAQEQQATSPVTINRPITGNFERPDEQPHELSQIEDGLIAKQPKQQIDFEESIEQVRIQKPDALNVLQSKTKSASNLINKGKKRSDWRTENVLVEITLPFSEMTDKICHYALLPRKSRFFRKVIDGVPYSFTYNNALDRVKVQRLIYVENHKNNSFEQRPKTNDAKSLPYDSYVTLKELAFQLTSKKRIRLKDAPEDVIRSIKSKKQQAIGKPKFYRQVVCGTVYLVSIDSSNKHIKVYQLIFDETGSEITSDTSISEEINNTTDVNKTQSDTEYWPFEGSPIDEVPIALNELPQQLRQAIVRLRKNPTRKEQFFRRAIDGVGYAVHINRSCTRIRVQRYIFPEIMEPKKPSINLDLGASFSASNINPKEDLQVRETVDKTIGADESSERGNILPNLNTAVNAVIESEKEATETTKLTCDEPATPIVSNAEEFVQCNALPEELIDKIELRRICTKQRTEIFSEVIDDIQNVVKIKESGKKVSTFRYVNNEKKKDSSGSVDLKSSTTMDFDITKTADIDDHANDTSAKMKQMTVITLENNGEIFRITLQDPMFWAKWKHLVRKTAVPLGEEPQELKNIIDYHKCRSKRKSILFRHAVHGEFFTVLVDRKNRVRSCRLIFSGTILNISSGESKQPTNPNAKLLKPPQKNNPTTIVTVEYNGEVFHIALEDEYFWLKWKHLVHKEVLPLGEEPEELKNAIADYKKHAEHKDCSFRLAIKGNLYTITVNKNGCVRQSRLIFSCAVLNISTKEGDETIKANEQNACEAETNQTTEVNDETVTNSELNVNKNNDNAANIATTSEPSPSSTNQTNKQNISNFSEINDQLPIDLIEEINNFFSSAEIQESFDYYHDNPVGDANAAEQILFGKSLKAILEETDTTNEAKKNSELNQENNPQNGASTLAKDKIETENAAEQILFGKSSKAILEETGTTNEANKNPELNQENNPQNGASTLAKDKIETENVEVEEEFKELKESLRKKLNTLPKQQEMPSNIDSKNSAQSAYSIKPLLKIRTPADISQMKTLPFVTFSSSEKEFLLSSNKKDTTVQVEELPNESFPKQNPSKDGVGSHDADMKLRSQSQFNKNKC